MSTQQLSLALLISWCCIHPVAATETFEDAFNKAGKLFSQNQYADAAQAYRQAIAINPHSPQSHFNLAVTLLELKEFVQAEYMAKRALELSPEYTRAHIVLGKIYSKLSNRENAITHLKKSLDYDPGNKEAVLLLIEELKEELRVKEAISYLEQALAYHPEDTRLEFTLANTLNMGGRTREALHLYLKINEKHQNDAGLLYNIAYTYKKLGMMKECLPYYDKALSLKPDHSEARFSQGLAHLVLGDFEKGWDGYEHRWNRSETLRLRSYPEPQLTSVKDVKNKRIFVHAEQGLGDTFQFIRYLRKLKKLGAHVIFAPQKPLMDLLKLCPYIDELIPYAQRPAQFDYHIPLVSLPHLFKTRIETVPCDIPYLYADDELVSYWRDQLAADTNFRIGICWQGNSQYSTAFLRAAVADKSMPAALFEPLTHIPGVTVYSLQRVTGTEQLKTLPETMKLHVFEGDFDSSHGRFCDTAAVMKNLDLVISIDTSICHLAAALGVPVWNLLPNPPDWRWMLETEETPWYPNMRLLRQPTPGDWKSSINTAVHEIIQMICPNYKPTETQEPQRINTVISNGQQKTLSAPEQVIAVSKAQNTNTHPEANLFPKPYVKSWGSTLSALAQAYVAYESTVNEKQRLVLLESIEKLELFTKEKREEIPLLTDYMDTLRTIHTRLIIEHDPKIRTLFEEMQQSVIQKIDLFVHVHPEEN